jgi:hydroxypyruvate reductase
VSDIHVLAVSKLSPLYVPQLVAAYTLHDRLHDLDPDALARIAPQIRAIAASGESKVPAALIERLPALELI